MKERSERFEEAKKIIESGELLEMIDVVVVKFDLLNTYEICLTLKHYTDETRAGHGGELYIPIERLIRNCGRSQKERLRLFYGRNASKEELLELAELIKKQLKLPPDRTFIGEGI